jgi:hypothetical protein
MRPRNRILLLVAAVLFFLINVGGAVIALREHQALHAAVHVVLAVATGYLLPHIVRRLGRRDHVRSEYSAS